MENLTIKVYGSGCKGCQTLHQNVIDALAEMNVAADLQYITDMQKIPVLPFKNQHGNQRGCNYLKVPKKGCIPRSAVFYTQYEKAAEMAYMIAMILLFIGLPMQSAV